MASSSSHIKRYHVFPSFHGPDVRRGFLSHLHNLFARKGITTFKDQKMERGHTIGPELVKAIREARASIVVLSKNYASSSWCLDELVEIMKCKEAPGQIVMTIFYDVDPSDVRKQKGDFGRAFERTCEGKSKEVKQRWIEALRLVADIAGEHSLNWDDEAAMAEKFSTDVSNKLNLTLSRDFDGMVGLEAHLTKLSTLLRLESDEVKMIGIWGPAGIGKTTIARALFHQTSTDFPLSCFMGNLRGGSCKSIMGVDDYDSKLALQSQLLSNILNQRDIRVRHLGSIKEWLQDQRVLIILDDVDDLEKLEALAKEHSWFGPGSRIIVTTEDQKILTAHGINDIYHVDFPSKKEALEILCLSAFKQSSPPDGFEELAKKVSKLCGHLPLGLCVVGSSMRGESKHEWELQLSRIESSLDRKIENVLRVGYDRLSKEGQALYLHIACFFNRNGVGRVSNMLADSNLDFENGLKMLVNKSLVHIGYDYIDAKGSLMMHCLLQQLGRQVVHEQSDEPGKRQFLLEAGEIRDVLANETGTGSVVGISFDMSKVEEFSMSGRVFAGMRNLRFLRFYNGRCSLLGDMTYLPRLRLLEWGSYPAKRLPPTFQPECLVELDMRSSNLEKLWRGIQPLTNLKEMNLSDSLKLKEIPDLSKATNLETLKLDSCTSLVELPSSFRNLQKLKLLDMSDCRKLRVIPTNINLASLKRVDLSGCSRLRSFPDLSSNIKFLNLGNTKIKDVPASIARSCHCLGLLFLGSKSLNRLTHVPECLNLLNLSNSDIKRIPDCVIGLPKLHELTIENCRKLMSLQSLPLSLWRLNAADCGSLKSVSYSFDKPRSSSYYNPSKEFTFRNCLKLDEEARRLIIQGWHCMNVLLPGKEIPAEFTHIATGNSITISEGSLSASSRFKACLLLSPTMRLQIHFGYSIRCCVRSKGVVINELRFSEYSRPQNFLTEHLLVFSGVLINKRRYHEVDVTRSEVQFEFSCEDNDMIIECGVQILSSGSSKWMEQSDEAVRKEQSEVVQVCNDKSVTSSKHTGWWSWLKKLCVPASFITKLASSV